jgi:glycosyltransferase involved in cell wall biosynthesis
LPIFAARWLEYWAYRNSAEIIALSPGMKTGIIKSGYPEAKVHLIPNSADLDLFDISIEAGQQFRQYFDWLGTRPLVVYTGTMGKINGVEYLVRVAAEVYSCFPEVRFLVVGEGGESSKVQLFAQELGVLRRNFFVLDALPKAEIPTVLSAADIATSLFINLPEMWANSANKFFDALASGTPIAINYRGWQAELLENENAGLVLDAQDISKAASQLMRALNDKHWLEHSGLTARKLAKERFSRDKLARQLETVLLNTVGKYSPT